MLVQLFFRRNKFMLEFHPRFKKREGEHLEENTGLLQYLHFIKKFPFLSLSQAITEARESRHGIKARWTSIVSYHHCRTTPIFLKYLLVPSSFFCMFSISSSWCLQIDASATLFRKKQIYAWIPSKVSEKRRGASGGEQIFPGLAQNLHFKLG